METSIKYFTDFFLYKNFVKMNSPEKKCPLCSRIEINSKIFSPSNQLHIIKNKYVRTWFQPTIATSVDWDSLLKKCIRCFHCHMFSETPLRDWRRMSKIYIFQGVDYVHHFLKKIILVLNNIEKITIQSAKNREIKAIYDKSLRYKNRIKFHTI